MRMRGEKTHHETSNANQNDEAMVVALTAIQSVFPGFKQPLEFLFKQDFQSTSANSALSASQERYGCSDEQCKTLCNQLDACLKEHYEKNLSWPPSAEFLRRYKSWEAIKT
jgi:hypothetical protein